MKLTDLHPQFTNAGGEGIFNADMPPATPRYGVGLIFDCPCGKCDEYHRCHVGFSNPLDGGPAFDPSHPIWTRTGYTLESLTLTPSIHRSRGCGWHGFITNGEIITC